MNNDYLYWGVIIIICEFFLLILDQQTFILFLNFFVNIIFFMYLMGIFILFLYFLVCVLVLILIIKEKAAFLIYTILISYSNNAEVIEFYLCQLRFFLVLIVIIELYLLSLSIKLFKKTCKKIKFFCKSIPKIFFYCCCFMALFL